MPSFALFRSVQLGSLVPSENWHIEPVRSSTIMMSSGTASHGEHADAVALTWIDLMPISPRNVVGTSALCVTETVFAGRQPGKFATHVVETLVATVGTFGIGFLPPAP